METILEIEARQPVRDVRYPVVSLDGMREERGEVSNFTLEGPEFVKRGFGTSRALLIDSHAIVREGLRRLLSDFPDISVVAESGDGRAALDLIRQCEPEMVIMDMNLASLDGLDVIATIHRRHAHVRVIVLSSAQFEAQAAAALDAGAHAFVLKHSKMSTLANALRSVRAGHGSYVDPQLSSEHIARLRKPKEGGRQINSGLTPRERQVLKLIAEGLRNRDVGQSLFISTKTVETHRLNLMQKLDAHSTADLSRWAFRLGLMTF